MKNFLLILKNFAIISILILTASVINAQTRTASVTGNWNNVATWGGASVPTSANDVVINNSVTVTVNVAAACASVTIGATNQTGGITISGTNSLAVTNGITIGDLTDNSSGILISVGTGSLSCASLTMADVTGSNDDIALTMSSGSVTVTGSLTMNGAAAENRVDITGAGTLTVGDLSPTNGTFNNSATSTVNYTGGTQTIRATSYLNLSLAGTGAKTITGVTVNGTLSIQGTTTTAGTTPTYAAAAILEYKGSAAQTVSDVEFGGTGANPANLSIDNTNGVTLSTAKSINGALTLVNGYLTTTGLLTINAAGSATTANGAFVNGQLAKVKTSTTLFTFLVGTVSGGLRTIGVTPVNTNNTTYTAQFIKSNPQTAYTGSVQSPLVRISACEHWILNRSTAGAPADAAVTLSWSAASCGGSSYVTDPPTLLVARYNGTNWVSEGNASNTSSTVTSNAVSSFSPFALGSSSVAQNPLPVVFANVKAYEKNNGVQVEWSNMTESDVVNYAVERSSNGRSFTAISQQLPKSNQNKEENYSNFDASPLAGINFYRIKAMENSGKIIYSKILKVDIGSVLKSISLYPNPVKDNLVSIGISAKQGQYTLKVLNSAGQQVYSKLLIHQGGNMTQTIELPSSVKSGVYNMVISGDNYRESKMFIIQ
jgi:Secretion system C-terminal sorting domain